MDRSTTEHSREIGLRLHPPYFGRFLNHQMGAAVVTFVAATVAAALVAVLGPHLWLWPEASGGSLHHWVIGIGVGVLCLAIAGTTVDDLDRQTHFAGTGTFHGPEQTTKRAVLLLGFAVLVTWPAWGRVAEVWQANDLAAAAPVAVDVAVRLLPVAVITLVPAAARYWVHEVRTHLWHQQRHDETESNTPAVPETPAPLSPVHD